MRKHLKVVNYETLQNQPWHKEFIHILCCKRNQKIVDLSIILRRIHTNEGCERVGNARLLLQ